MTSTSVIVDQVAATHPGLETLRLEHLAFHGEVLPYLYMADVARWATEEYVSGDRSNVQRLLTLLEHLFASGSDESRNLVVIGFVESMPSTGDSGAAMRSMLGPLLAAEFSRVNW